MTTLAPKVPYTHPFAGGYPRLGGQPLPTDPDAINYLNRVAAADGAAVEVGVAMAVDAFIKGCKADGIWDAIKASCILCGARTISGALVPLVGTAPTAYSFASGDYDRSSGLKGNGSTKYIDSNRANDADGQDDQHLAVYQSSLATVTSGLIGSRVSVSVETGGSQIVFVTGTPTYHFGRIHSESAIGVANASAGFVGSSRSSSAENIFRQSQSNHTQAQSSETPNTENVHVFRRNGAGGNIPTDARLAFYSIGASLDLAALDNRVTTLVAAIAAAI